MSGVKRRVEMMHAYNIWNVEFIKNKWELHLDKIDSRLVGFRWPSVALVCDFGTQRY